MECGASVRKCEAPGKTPDWPSQGVADAASYRHNRVYGTRIWSIPWDSWSSPGPVSDSITARTTDFAGGNGIALRASYRCLTEVGQGVADAGPRWRLSYACLVPFDWVFLGRLMAAESDSLLLWELRIEPRGEFHMAALARKIGCGLASVAGLARIGAMRKK
jgi:hypothetical protein